MTLDPIRAVPHKFSLDSDVRKAAAPTPHPDSFQELFTSKVSIVPQSLPAAPVAKLAPPVYEQGATVSAPDGSSTALNPVELASSQTATDIAAMLGGTVSNDVFGGGYSTSAPTREISFANSSVKINAGLAASLFATYGTAQGSQAWRIINNDLGRDPMATGPMS